MREPQAALEHTHTHGRAPRAQAHTHTHLGGRRGPRHACEGGDIDEILQSCPQRRGRALCRLPREGAAMQVGQRAGGRGRIVVTRLLGEHARMLELLSTRAVQSFAFP